jgi:hypothetical protein
MLKLNHFAYSHDLLKNVQRVHTSYVLKTFRIDIEKASQNIEKTTFLLSPLYWVSSIKRSVSPRI